MTELLRCTETLAPPLTSLVKKRKSIGAQRTAFKRALPYAPFELPDWLRSDADEHDAWQLVHAAFVRALPSVLRLFDVNAVQCDVIGADDARAICALSPLHISDGEHAMIVSGAAFSDAERRAVRGRHYVHLRAFFDAPPRSSAVVALRVAHVLAPIAKGSDCELFESIVLQRGECVAVPLGGQSWPVCFAAVRCTGDGDQHTLGVYIEATYAARAILTRVAHASLRHAAATSAPATLDWADGGVLCSSEALGPALLAHWYACLALEHPLVRRAGREQLAGELACVTRRVSVAVAREPWGIAAPACGAECAPSTPLRLRQPPPPPPPSTPPPLTWGEAETPPAKRARAAPHPAFVYDEDLDFSDQRTFNLDRSFAPNASQ